MIRFDSLKVKYGLLIKTQIKPQKCEICKSSPVYLDKDTSTGYVRGLLCWSCKSMVNNSIRTGTFNSQVQEYLSLPTFHIYVEKTEGGTEILRWYRSDKVQQGTKIIGYIKGKPLYLE